jgi:hypothetical protein
MGIFKLGKYKGLVTVLVLFLAATGAMLAINYVFAARTAESLSALRDVSEQRFQPRVHSWCVPISPAAATSGADSMN